MAEEDLQHHKPSSANGDGVAAADAASCGSVVAGYSQPVLQSYSLKDVKKHDTPEDCWLIIWGKVYDVTSWVPKHPGGSLIHVKAGQDCTQLFESYHPLYVRKMLGKYCIGEVVQNSVVGGDELLKSSRIEYLNAGNEDFYLVLKQRVETFFKQKKINPRFHPHMFMKSIIIILGYVLCYYCCFFSSSSFVASLFWAVGMGFFATEVGVSIQHDGNHGAYSQWCGLGYIMGASLDFIGASSFMWRQQHVVGHHSFTNVDHYDPDIRVKDPDVRRVTSEQPGQWYHAYQHIYLGALYGLLALKSVFLDDFNAYFSGSIGPVRIAKMTQLEFNVFFGGKLFYAFYMFLLPALYGSHTARSFILLYMVSQFVTGWMLALVFQVAHVVGEAEFPELDPSSDTPKVAAGWAALQVATTTNFCPKSLFWTHLTGGLNNQIEHHLFPSVCHLYYPRIQPIVKATCDEFNVPYTWFPTFWAALKAHFAHLKKVGLVELHLDG
ncbi:unnamed protein product [Sphagnum jensenii]|uniref:Cytochrome b5 heme-binding domain-containing protein n=1 Tax=Sphagnum jensenii TaxID=128206 RepID=A0ABP0VJF9_9BRYO